MMSGSGVETLPCVREWSRGPLGCSKVVGRPPGRPEVVGRPSRLFGSGWEALHDIRKWCGDPPG